MLGTKVLKPKKKNSMVHVKKAIFLLQKSKRICRLNKKNDHSFFSVQHLNILVVLALVIKVPMVIYSFFLQLSKYRYVTINENSLRYSVGPSGYNLFLLCPLVSMFYTLL